MPVNFSDLKGLTLTNVALIDDGYENHRIEFTEIGGRKFVLAHHQECCEHVTIESVVGDIADLIGSPILLAEESSSGSRPADLPVLDYEPDSQTWTFYKLATIKGYVDIRWFGESNGYYSESVDFDEITPKGN